MKNSKNKMNGSIARLQQMSREIGQQKAGISIDSEKLFSYCSHVLDNSDRIKNYINDKSIHFAERAFFAISISELVKFLARGIYYSKNPEKILNNKYNSEYSRKLILEVFIQISGLCITYIEWLHKNDIEIDSLNHTATINNFLYCIRVYEAPEIPLQSENPLYSVTYQLSKKSVEIARNECEKKEGETQSVSCLYDSLVSHFWLFHDEHSIKSLSNLPKIKEPWIEAQFLALIINICARRNRLQKTLTHRFFNVFKKLCENKKEFLNYHHDIQNNIFECVINEYKHSPDNSICILKKYAKLVGYDLDKLNSPVLIIFPVERNIYCYVNCGNKNEIYTIVGEIDPRFTDNNFEDIKDTDMYAELRKKYRSSFRSAFKKMELWRYDEIKILPFGYTSLLPVHQMPDGNGRRLIENLNVTYLHKKNLVHRIHKKQDWCLIIDKNFEEQTDRLIKYWKKKMRNDNILVYDSSPGASGITAKNILKYIDKYKACIYFGHSINEMDKFYSQGLNLKVNEETTVINSLTSLEISHNSFFKLSTLILFSCESGGINTYVGESIANSFASSGVGEVVSCLIPVNASSMYKIAQNYINKLSKEDKLLNEIWLEESVHIRTKGANLPVIYTG